MKPIQYTVELTDTFAGEANYSWVRRRTITVPDTITDRGLVRHAKRALGINERTKTENWGESIVLKFPRHRCVVAFITLNQ